MATSIPGSRATADANADDQLGGSTLRVTVKVLKLGSRVRTALDLHHAIQKGLSYSGLERLATALDTDADEVARVVALPKRTMARRRATGQLSATESERVVRLTRAYARALDVFGDEAKARRWLRAPNRGLGGEAPIALVETDVGARAVEDVLGRIEHGIVG